MQLSDTLIDAHIHFYVDGKKASIDEIGYIINSMVKKSIKHLKSILKYLPQDMLYIKNVDMEAFSDYQ